MNRDRIIELAREAWGVDHEIFWFEDDGIERFAALVAAEEREACAKVCDELAALNRESPTDSMWEWYECAAAIRARGETR